MSTHTHIHTHIYMHAYIYMEIERDRKREKNIVKECNLINKGKTNVLKNFFLRQTLQYLKLIDSKNYLNLAKKYLFSIQICCQSSR